MKLAGTLRDKAKKSFFMVSRYLWLYIVIFFVEMKMEFSCLASHHNQSHRFQTVVWLVQALYGLLIVQTDE